MRVGLDKSWAVVRAYSKYLINYEAFQVSLSYHHLEYRYWSAWIGMSGLERGQSFSPDPNLVTMLKPGQTFLGSGVKVKSVL